jgi:hypothetical protein
MVFLRGITSKTTEMLVDDPIAETRTTEMLVDDPIAETSRLRGIGNNAGVKKIVKKYVMRTKVSQQKSVVI